MLVRRSLSTQLPTRLFSVASAPVASAAAKTDSKKEQKPKKPFFRASRVFWIAVAGITIGKYTSDEFNTVFWRLYPTRILSFLWGQVHRLELPVAMRSPLYMVWTKAFGCHLDEMAASSLEEFPNLNAFFTRRLKPEVRPIEQDAAMVSPVDARVTVVGKVEDGKLEQIKVGRTILVFGTKLTHFYLTGRHLPAEHLFRINPSRSSTI